MNTTTPAPSALKWRKLAPGMYEARTGPEDWDRYEAVLIEPLEDHGYGRAPWWALTYPGARVADSSLETLRECKRQAQADHDAARMVTP